MTTTRFLLILLLLINALLFAAAQDWFGFASGESGNVSIELNRENIKVLGHTPPPDAAQADDQDASEQPVGCLAWSGLSAVQNNKLISLFSAAGIQAVARDVQVASSWRVINAIPMVTHEAAELLADNMIDLGVERESIQIEETGDGKFLIVLGGSFKNKKSADRHLEAVKGKGVNASIDARNTSERRVEATVSKEKAETLLNGQSFAKRYKSCS
jgi:hypothetical protein